MNQPQNKEDITENSLKKMKGFAIASFLTVLARFGIRLVKNVITTRILGPEGRGLFGLLITIPDLLISVGNIGFGVGNAYLVAKKKYELRKILGNTFLVTSLLGGILIGAGYLLMSFQGILKGDFSTLSDFSTLVIFIIPIILLERFCHDLLLATQKVHLVNNLGLLTSLLPCILLPGLRLFTGESLSSAMFAWVFATVAVALLSVFKLMALCNFKTQISLPYIKESLHFGGRSLLGVFAGIFVRKVDVIFISSMLGATQLGFYAISISISEILVSLQSAITTPFMAIRYGLETQEASKVTPIAIRHVLFFSLVSAVLAAISGKYIIIILFGESFLPAYYSLLILLPGVIALSINELVKFDLYSHNLPEWVSMAEVSALVCNIILNFLLIPTYGIEGAAISTSISYFLAAIILLEKFRSRIRAPYSEILVLKKTELVNIAREIPKGIKILKTMRWTDTK